MTYKGCHSGAIRRILFMLVSGVGIRDVSVIKEISIRKVLLDLVRSSYVLKPRQTYYTSLEVDEFWIYVQKKSNKVWLIYAYDRSSGEIAAYVWGKRHLKTAKALRDKLSALGVTCTKMSTDDWSSFVKAFKSDVHIIGKANTVGIEGNNCRLRHRTGRAFRKICRFSKKLFNHLKAFDPAFFYINFGYI